MQIENRQSVFEVHSKTLVFIRSMMGFWMVFVLLVIIELNSVLNINISFYDILRKLFTFLVCTCIPTL